jgi:DNA helicase-2/ATP-dependent DNA helicase PcrA
LDGATDPAAVMREFRMPGAAAQDWSSLFAVYQRLHTEHGDWPAEFESLLDWYAPQLERIYDDATLRMPDLAQLQRIAATYASRERFLTELTLDPPAATSAEAGAPLIDEDYLTLSTIHSSKGQEWKVVQILNCIDGCIPSDMATGKADEIEEERRLLYVAMTRAKDALTLLLPQRFYVRQQSGMGDRHVYAARSRFLTEAICERFDQQSWPSQPDQAMNIRAPGTTKVDLRALLRETWTAPKPNSA